MDTLKITNVMIGLDVESKEDALVQMVLLAAHDDIAVSDVADALSKREANIYSYCKEGYSFPHVCSSSCRRLAISLAILKEPLEWDSGRMVTWILAVMGDTRDRKSYFHFLAQAARLAMSDKFRANVLSAKNVQETPADVE